MHITQIASVVRKFTIDNSPLLLTGIGAFGTITTAILSGKASYKAAGLLEQQEKMHFENPDRFPEPPTTKEKLRLVWPLYVPALANATITVTCIVMANRVGTKRAAALAAAYTISEKAFEEYRDKVVEKLGPNKEKAARDEIAQERVDRNPVGKNEVILTGGGDVLCYDAYSGRYFRSDMESIKKAQNDLNHRIINHMYASLNDFYDRLGLEHVQMGEEVGWNSDDLLEIFFTTTISIDQLPAISIEFHTKPIRNYFRTH